MRTRSSSGFWRTPCWGAEGPSVKKMVTPAAKREAVAHLVETYEISERWACHLIMTDRKTVCYRSRRPRDEVLRHRLT